MPLVIEGADQLKELAKKLKSADPKIRRELVSSLRPKVKPVTAEVQQTVRTAPSRGRRGLGHRRRAAKALSRTRVLSGERAYSQAARKHKGPATEAQVHQVKTAHRARQTAKAEAGAGLRESIARATTGAISTGSKATGVSVTWKVKASRMPNSQRKLAKAFNSAKGWRHPVFGDREDWVTQHGTPYFDTVIKKHQGELRDAVVDGMTKAADAILHEKAA